MAIKRVSLSWVAISDYKRSKEFFTKTLGLKVFEEQEKYGWLELSGQEGMVMGVCKENGDASFPSGANAVITFVADNYDQTKKELTKKGIVFFGEISGNPEVPRMVCFKDPDGNIFQLVEETKGHTDQSKKINFAN